jgi:hypothetical protein
MPGNHARFVFSVLVAYNGKQVLAIGQRVVYRGMAIPWLGETSSS